jgi:hypothetical protein
MIKKSILVLFVLISAGIVTANLNRKMSAAAPASSTGGPDENHCSSAGCHDDKSVNIGKAISNVSIEGLVDEKYTPGKKYKVIVSIEDADIKRFGFQLTALFADKTKAGMLENIDENRTQIISNYVDLKDREYITYTYNSTLAKQIGKTDWEFYWTAPNMNKGDVQFYVGTVSANDDGTDKGDFTYKSNLKISAAANSSSSILKNVANKTKLSQVGRVLSVSTFIPNLTEITIILRDFKGNTIDDYTVPIKKVGYEKYMFELSNKITTGYYLISIENGGEIISTSKTLLTF